MKLSHLVIAAFAISGAGTIAAAHGNKVSDNSVSQAQQALNDKGFSAGPVDGIAGPQTKSALKQFQQSQGLQASGQLDTQTLAALEPGASSSSQGAASPFSPNDTQPSASSNGSQSSQASDTSMSSSPTISQSTSSMGSSQPPSSATPSDQSTSSQQSSNSSSQSSSSRY